MILHHNIRTILHVLKYFSLFVSKIKNKELRVWIFFKNCTITIETVIKQKIISFINEFLHEKFLIKISYTDRNTALF